MENAVVKRDFASYTRPGMATVITHIGQLVTPLGATAARGDAMGQLHIAHNVEILIEDRGRIAQISQTVPRDGVATVIDAGGGVIVPGFVDAHTHAVFARGREEEFLARAQGVAYDGGGILASADHVAQVTLEELIAHARPFLQRMLAHGTTTAEVKSGYGLSVDGEVKLLLAIRALGADLPLTLVPTFLGAHSFPQGMSRDDYLALLIEVMLPRVKQESLATFCVVFCDRGFYTPGEARAVLLAASAAGLGLKLHADELADTGGASLAADVGATSADHLIRANRAGLERLADAGVVAVLLPGTSFTLNTRYAPARDMVAMGVPVAVASDFNPGSCPIYSMPVMISLAVSRLGLTVEEAITASTLNGAAALGMAAQTGSVEVGKLADLLVLDLDSYRQLPYYFAHNPVRTVFVAGRVVHGDPP